MAPSPMIARRGMRDPSTSQTAARTLFAVERVETARRRDPQPSQAGDHARQLGRTTRRYSCGQ
jgi:hypothetical protein